MTAKRGADEGLLGREQDLSPIRMNEAALPAHSFTTRVDRKAPEAERVP